MMIKFEKVTKSYGNRHLFKDFSYEFPTTGIVAIVGASGTGKSTILNMISGLDINYDGKVKIDNFLFKENNEKNTTEFRLSNIGYVFQNYSLLNTDSVYWNILLPLDTNSNANNYIKKKKVKETLKLVGLSKYERKRVNTLSGGEKQRVAIARSIVNNPKVILCDEPTGALDTKNSESIFELLRRIANNKLVVIATHDIKSIRKYADVFLEIKGEKVIFANNKPEESKDTALLVGCGNNKKKPKVSINFKLRHAFHKLKAKKYRSLIVNLMLSLSLTGIGLSIILSSSVSNKVNDAFKEILNGNQIILTRKNENESTFANAYSASYSKITEIYEKYNYLLDGFGVNYLVNYEDFFKDRNDFYLGANGKKFIISSYSCRTINDFRWIQENDTHVIYPSPVIEIDDDQVVLGITYSDMVNICYNLQIQRNFTSLGHYIFENDLTISLEVRNDNWQYDDEQIFKVVGVCETSISCFYHTNKLWNEKVFETMMCLPCDDDESHDFPWEMFKIYYLKTKGDPSQFLDNSLYDDDLGDYVFERTNYEYNPLLCKTNEVCEERRLYVYISDKYFVSGSIIDEIISADLPLNYYFISDYGYASYASNLLAGFSKNIFLGINEDDINNAIDAEAQIDDENIAVDLPKGIVQGNYLNSLSGGVRFSTIFDGLIKGRKPTNLNEIVISKGLMECFGYGEEIIGKYLTIAGEISEYYDENNSLFKDYRKSKVVVVGITSEKKNYIYHSPNWSISFFRDKLGISSFYLVPKGIVFEFNNRDDANRCKQVLTASTQDYKISSPIDELQTNINSTLDYADTILFAFSVLSTLISTLLLGTVIMLNVIENKDEIVLLNYLGISTKDINSCFIFHGIVQGLLAFVASAFELIVVDFSISYLLDDMLNIGLKFTLNPKPIFIIFLVSLILPIIISKITLLFMKKKRHINLE